MNSFPRLVVLTVLALGAIWVAEPFEPRPIAARGDLVSERNVAATELKLVFARKRDK
jgi:hypothetical protein